MCMVLNASNINGSWVLYCSEHDGEFLGAKTLKIINNDNKVYETRDFLVDKTKPCFSKGGNPLVMVKNHIPNEFLEKGNSVYLD